MQSRLAAAAMRSCVLSRGRPLGQLLTSASASAGRSADPAIHSGDDGADPTVYTRDPENLDDVANPRPAKEQLETETLHVANADAEPLVSPPKTPGAATRKLETIIPVNQYVDSNFQQKRLKGSFGSEPSPLDSVSCAGLDGSPLADKVEETVTATAEHKTLSDKEYYEHHKASPLSEMEMADTRKPITQATDGTAAPSYYGLGSGVVGWLPEQLDTAEEALRRATEIFRQNAARGDPETFPHSRILREMRGEWF